jgi:catechol 2,3-dioxygenase-like lactoylglutathione lyase family enzyme
MSHASTMLSGLAVMATSLTGALGCSPEPPLPALTTVALRTHHQQAMLAFYEEALGVRFRLVRTGQIESRFGELPGLTLKFVPIRPEADFKGFPVHQLGFEVADIEAVIASVVRHGGRVANAPVRIDGRIHAAIRDPDGNTLELYQSR